jgi:hypothetical protein
MNCPDPKVKFQAFAQMSRDVIWYYESIVRLGTTNDFYAILHLRVSPNRL